MFVTKTNAASIAALTALACGVCVTKDVSAGAPPVIDKEAAKAVEMSPLGIVHDFGKLQRGAKAEHAFRIVNTSGVPLEIISVNRGVGCSAGPITVRVPKWRLQPNEEGTVQVSLDTSRFRGRRTYRVRLETDNGKPMVTVFYVTADAQNPAQP